MFNKKKKSSCFSLYFEQKKKGPAFPFFFETKKKNPAFLSLFEQKKIYPAFFSFLFTTAKLVCASTGSTKTEEGATPELTCSAQISANDASLKPEFQWYRGGEPVEGWEKQLPET